MDAPQDEQQPTETPEVVAPVGFFQVGIGNTPDNRGVILQLTIAPYGVLSFVLDPDAAFKISRDMQQHASQAKTGLQVIRSIR